jgi:hypothetical protein
MDCENPTIDEKMRRKSKALFFMEDLFFATIVPQDSS